MGWDAQNRKRRHRSEDAVTAAIGRAQERSGDWFTVRELYSDLSDTTNRKYLDMLAEDGKIERKVIGGLRQNMVVYRRKGEYVDARKQCLYEHCQ